MERGENSEAAAGEDFWAKLVPLDSRYPDVELRSDNVTVLSEINSSLSEKQEWCRIEKYKNQVSALMRIRDRTRLPLNHSEMINPRTYVCNECYDKLVSFLLYWFPVTLPKHVTCSYLPSEALQREDRWYGSACRTQHDNEEHARKREPCLLPDEGYP